MSSFTPGSDRHSDVAASPSRSADLKATLRIAQLDSDDDTNPTWDDFEQALATVDALAARALSLEPRIGDRASREAARASLGL